MSTREEMHSLVQEIIGSYEARVAGIASLREGVMAQLRELDAVHQAMARQQRTDLAKGHSALASSVARQLKGLDAVHQAMARQQRTDLAKGHSALASSVAHQLKGLDAAHQAMARQQRTDLTQAEARRKSQVRGWLKEVATTHAEASDEWQKLATTMQAKRGVPVAAVAPPRPPVHAVAEEPVAEVLPEVAALRDRVFTYLADHLNGTRMTELEQEFGLPRIQMARVLKSLTDENKVEKRDFLYYAV